ncbi:lactonase family protein [Aestuariimicrobium kwangyangense]|uniref:lactonase family protein n=1 Tax=Aestuariimicrobium kwangyangense TaxID=396389 RepID=UPI0003B651BF|nr:beta-propeller fold lactonase family protein [Aestuariimicrobium kwangyangense]
MSTLLVGCFTDESGVGGLQLFGVDGHQLTPIAQAAVPSPTWLVEAGDHVVAASHTQGSPLVRLDVDADGITVGSRRDTSGLDGCHASLSPDGSAVAIAHYSSGSLAVVPLVEGGWGDATVVRFGGQSGVVPDRQEAPHAHQAVWLDEEHLLVCDLGADAVRVVSWLDGHLRQVGKITTTPGFGPRHLVVRRVNGPHGAQTQVAVGGELDGNVASYRHHDGTGGSPDWTTGWERVSQVQGTLVGEAQPSALRLLDEQTLVVANRRINTLGVLEWHESGQLVLADEFDCGGDHPRDVVVHEGDIWVANQGTGDVCCFTRRGLDSETCSWRLASRTSVEAPGALLFR